MSTSADIRTSYFIMAGQHGCVRVHSARSRRSGGGGGGGTTTAVRSPENHEAAFTRVRVVVRRARGRVILNTVRAYYDVV